MKTFEVEGYDKLDDVHRKMYDNFIINFTIKYGECTPLKISYVEEVKYLVREHPDEELFTVAGERITEIDRNGNRTVIEDCVWNEYKKSNILDQDIQTYLKFEYDMNNGSHWLHVISDKEWY